MGITDKFGKYDEEQTIEYYNVCVVIYFLIICYETFVRVSFSFKSVFSFVIL